MTLSVIQETEKRMLEQVRCDSGHIIGSVEHHFILRTRLSLL